MGSNVLEDLLDARISRDRGQHVDGLRPYLRIAVVKNNFEDGVADVHVVGKIGRQAAESLRPHGGVRIVTQGNHESIAHAVIGPTVHRAHTGMGQESQSGVLHRRIERRTRAEEQQVTNIRVVGGDRPLRVA